MKRKTVCNVSLAASFILLSGCQNYLERTEGVTTFAGDAQAINRINQAEDPWARHAHDTHIHTDGKRVSGAVERYRNNTVESDTGITAPTTN